MPVLIRAGYGLLIALILASLLGSFYSLSRIGHELGTFKDSSNNSEIIAAVAEDLFEARLAAAEYGLTADPGIGVVVESNLNEILQEPGLADALSGVSQGRLLQEQILTGTEQLQASFNALVAQTRSLAGMSDQLEAQSFETVALLEQAAEQSLSAGKTILAQRANAALKEVQLGKFKSYRFVTTGNPSLLAEAATHFEQAQEQLELFSLEVFHDVARDTATTIVDLVSQMQAALPRLEEAYETRKELIDIGLGANGLALQDTIEAILDDLLDKQSAAGLYAVDTAELTQSASLLAGVVIALIAALVAVVVTRVVTARIRGLADRTDALVNGDLEIDIPGQDRSDETGRLARALVVFRNNRREAVLQEEREAQAQKDREAVVTALSDGLARMSNGDLDVRMTQTLAPDFETLRYDFNATAEQLSQAFSDIVEQTASIQDGAANLTSAADDLARRTEGQAAALEETAATIVQLTQSVGETATGTDKANDFVKTTRASAENSLTVVASTLESIKKIQATSNEVSQIIGVIDDIAFQTNLLALNAGVEAARAGAAGQGFAVVASEVRALAQRSSTAAKEIKQLIETSVSQVNEGVVKADETGEALNKIVGMVGEISDLMATISAETLSQSEGLKEINAAVSHLDTVTQQNAAMVEETTAASHELTHNARALNKITGAFKVGNSGSAGRVDFSSETALDEDWIAAQHAG
ncbi:methyl-accepting chemotaxis protein [Aestuariivita boseongensis]|uniref:methyl-accepting chemotaxis protein n=1 Tax=Aestuariivita boseongensis TaxID=1470562 RepID=UPI00155D96B1|nr:methyl-accepting chemotaxis protein [Aestuariivita boseongensis]